MRWLTLALLIGALAPGCTSPMIVRNDAGTDAATIADDAGTDAATVTNDAGMDAAVVDDAGTDAGTTGALSVSGALGTHGGAIPSSGSLVIVDDGFELSGMTCNGALCVYGGFR